MFAFMLTSESRFSLSWLNKVCSTDARTIPCLMSRVSHTNSVMACGE